MQSCIFCQIVTGAISSYTVFADDLTLAFLDHRPLFPGHCLIIPKTHYDTLLDLPRAIFVPLMATTQLLARAVECGLEAHGSFIAINNRISQSVPHLHVHVVPLSQTSTTTLEHRGSSRQSFALCTRVCASAWHICGACVDATTAARDPSALIVASQCYPSHGCPLTTNTQAGSPTVVSRLCRALV
jgi:diadenosine tetraphosphate (Ap4A) HIT family hydrolase